MHVHVRPNSRESNTIKESTAPRSVEREERKEEREHRETINGSLSGRATPVHGRSFFALTMYIGISIIHAKISQYGSREETRCDGLCVLGT